MSLASIVFCNCIKDFHFISNLCFGYFSLCNLLLGYNTNKPIQTNVYKRIFINEQTFNFQNILVNIFWGFPLECEILTRNSFIISYIYLTNVLIFVIFNKPLGESKMLVCTSLWHVYHVTKAIKAVEGTHCRVGKRGKSIK